VKGSIPALSEETVCDRKEGISIRNRKKTGESRDSDIIYKAPSWLLSDENTKPACGSCATKNKTPRPKDRKVFDGEFFMAFLLRLPSCSFHAGFLQAAFIQASK
jgi:hypothetical protein